MGEGSARRRGGDFPEHLRHLPAAAFLIRFLSNYFAGNQVIGLFYFNINNKIILSFIAMTVRQYISIPRMIDQDYLAVATSFCLV